MASARARVLARELSCGLMASGGMRYMSFMWQPIVDSPYAGLSDLHVRMFLRMFVANRFRSELKSETLSTIFLSHLDKEMGLRGKWNLRAYSFWYVHHEALFHDEFERFFSQPLIPGLYMGFVLEMYVAPPCGDGLQMEIVSSQCAGSSDP